MALLCCGGCRITANRCRVALREDVYPMTKHFCCDGDAHSASMHGKQGVNDYSLMSMICQC